MTNGILIVPEYAWPISQACQLACIRAGLIGIVVEGRRHRPAEEMILEALDSRTELLTKALKLSDPAFEPRRRPAHEHPRAAFKNRSLP